QGVGFRFTVRHIAKGFELTGWVRNLPDGRVELQVTGEEDEVRAFLDQIAQSELHSLIREQTENRLNEPAHARGFQHRYDASGGRWSRADQSFSCSVPSRWRGCRGKGRHPPHRTGRSVRTARPEWLRQEHDAENHSRSGVANTRSHGNFRTRQSPGRKSR